MEEIEAVPPLLSLLCDELNRERGDAPQISLQLVQERHANILQNFYERSFVDWPPSLRRLVEDRLVTVGGHRSSLAWEDAEAELAQAGVDAPRQPSNRWWPAVCSASRSAAASSGWN
jgi:hypothetical protein